ncbi:hypothetical protein, partial [Nocardia cyriacigeorgica]|uniref:hypothetical protein n=1 Tax=Nocardia cyriacigeorgica TaxID=135487 RepID=UPI002454F8F6
MPPWDIHHIAATGTGPGAEREETAAGAGGRAGARDQPVGDPPHGLLIERGVGAESYVALGMRRSIDLVVGMYAVSVA